MLRSLTLWVRPLYLSRGGSSLIGGQADEAGLAFQVYSFQKVSEEHKAAGQDTQENRGVLIFQVVVDFLGDSVYGLLDFFVRHVGLEALVI